MILYGVFHKESRITNRTPYLTWRHRQGGEKTSRRYNSVNIAQNQEILQRHDCFSQTNRLKPYNSMSRHAITHFKIARPTMILYLILRYIAGSFGLHQPKKHNHTSVIGRISETDIIWQAVSLTGLLEHEEVHQIMKFQFQILQAIFSIPEFSLHCFAGSSKYPIFVNQFRSMMTLMKSSKY